ncbi:hypothetical protein C0Z01_15380 [Photobacterium kishitanii]|uniref:hypothetical protein n=1 Tax=Photobacterium kishitanii TaxID=318456 RepID=UPI0005D33A82|nr:hypothetical protein [Photobacterium kishitanii]KJG08494.1 hypothetical protein UB40_17725 [Photobacterium kishitanii]OBU28384.1 hypothetical protein AYY22_14115 [Photobacterium kishitanii]OBU32927.1 hypothetical protein AYY23_16130 [Photobacterium kishitanii]PSU18313.1 hypothetical protein CTM84_17960 [Photobacterium kishitanii]PSV02790.1 hypothetical protein C0W96_19790 [Photobacterium kishitanii]
MQNTAIIVAAEVIIYLILVTYYLYARKKLHAHLYLNKRQRTIYLGNKPLLKLKGRSLNYQLLCYLFENPNRAIPKQELIDNIYRRDIYLNKLVANINLPKDMKDKLFLIEDDSLSFLSAHINHPN